MGAPSSRVLSGTPPEGSVTWSTVWPTRTRSPRPSVRSESMRSSLTKVPLADPRSSIVSWPLAARAIFAC